MEWSEINFTLTALLGGFLFKFTALQWMRQKKQKEFVAVGKVAGIYIYPIKGANSWSLESAYCTPVGLQHDGVTDRHFLVIKEDGVFLKHAPTSTLITTSSHGDVLHFDAPGMETVEVPKNQLANKSNLVKCRIWTDTIEAVDCGDVVNKWFSRYLNINGLKLLYYAPGIPKRYSARVIKPYPHKAQAGDRAAFADFTAYLITSEDSLAALNANLSTPVTSRNFRPNITVTGCEPFQEEKWTELRIGTASFRVLVPCSRCSRTTIDPDTGIMDAQQEPLKTLRMINSKAAYLNTPIFGLNAALDNTGVINIGDTVFAYSA